MAGTTRKRPRKPRANSQRAEEEGAAEFAILFPFVEVEITTGEKLILKQWDIDTGAILTTRVVSMMQKLAAENVKGDVEPEDLVRVAKEECLVIVSQTLHISVAELKARVPWEDFLTLLDVVANQNLIREDGGGAIPKFVGLASKLGPLAGLGRVPLASQPPSTSSSEPDTPSPISEA